MSSASSSQTTPHERRITVVSAHEGATTWVALCGFISDTSSYTLTSFHQFDDSSYRSARSFGQRLKLRVQTFVTFPLRFLWRARVLARDSDLLIVVTSPFFMPLLASFALGSASSRVIALMNDIYPEALVAKGLLKRGAVGERLLQKLFARALPGFAAVVFISERHRALVADYVMLPDHSPVIPVSAHSDPFTGHALLPVSGPAAITYCGTLGLMHDTGTFLSWLDESRDDPGVRFAFYLSGARKREFEANIRKRLQSPQCRVQVALGNSLAEADWARVMRATQVGLVFQDRGSGNVVFPSKIASVLAAGQAVLAVADRSSDIARLILSNDCGWVVEPGDTRSFDACIRDIAHGGELLHKRARAFMLGQNTFGKAAVARRWIDLFDSTVSCTAQVAHR